MQSSGQVLNEEEPGWLKRKGRTWRCCGTESSLRPHAICFHLGKHWSLFSQKQRRKFIPMLKVFNISTQRRPWSAGIIFTWIMDSMRWRRNLEAITENLEKSMRTFWNKSGTWRNKVPESLPLKFWMIWKSRELFSRELFHYPLSRVA